MVLQVRANPRQVDSYWDIQRLKYVFRAYAG